MERQQQSLYKENYLNLLLQNKRKSEKNYSNFDAKKFKDNDFLMKKTKEENIQNEADNVSDVDEDEEKNVEEEKQEQKQEGDEEKEEQEGDEENDEQNNEDMEDEEFEDDIANIVNNILTEKEVVLSSCLENIASHLNKDFSQFQADEAVEELNREIESKLDMLPLVFRHRWEQLLKKFVLEKHTKDFAKALVSLPYEPPQMQDMCLKYKNVFNAFVDDESAVSFQTEDKNLMGPKLQLKDAFILHCFAFATCRRIKSDKCFALAICGESTSGKSTLFEYPLLDFGHNFLTDGGVGRFKTQGKNILVAHDVSINILVKGKDADKLRAICRGEICKAKVHSDEQTLQPMFLLLTSNEHIQNHHFQYTVNLDKQTKRVHKTYKAVPVNQTRQLGSRTNVSGSGVKSSSPVYCQTFVTDFCKTNNNKKYNKQEDSKSQFVTAMQKRFLEVFVRAAPTVPYKDLPEAGTRFTRMHLVLGIYQRVASILAQPNISYEDFGSRVLFDYCWNGLVQNHEAFKTFAQYDEDVLLSDMKSIANKLPK